MRKNNDKWMYMTHPEVTDPVRIQKESFKVWEKLGWSRVDEDSKTNQPVKEEITLDSTQDSPGTPELEDSATQEGQSWHA